MVKGVVMISCRPEGAGHLTDSTELPDPAADGQQGGGGAP